MSNTILESVDVDGKPFQVTAFVGKNMDASVQITTTNDYICLDSKMTLELIRVLTARIDFEDGYRATD